MQSDDQRIMASRHLVGALRTQPVGIALGQDKLAETLQGHQAEDQPGQRHAARASERQLQVKPGPSAVSTVRRGSSALINRSSTNSTVGADMLPYASSTARSWSSVPWSRRSVASSAVITFAPPGWQAKRSTAARATPMRAR